MSECKWRGDVITAGKWVCKSPQFKVWGFCTKTIQRNCIRHEPPAPSQPCKWLASLFRGCIRPDAPPATVCPGYDTCEHYEPMPTKCKVSCKHYCGEEGLCYHSVASPRFRCDFAKDGRWDICSQYEPKAAERKESCKHLYADVICFRSGLRCDDRYKACEHYEPAVAPAATGMVSGHKFDTIIYDDVHNIAPLGKEFHDAMKRFVADVKTPKHYKCSTGLVGNIIGDTRPDDVMMWIESPRIDSKVMIEYLAKMDDIVKRIMNKTNKEDIDMSGIALKCRSCRDTFFKEEVRFLVTHATKVDQNGIKLERVEAGTGPAGEVVICDTCYARYREAVATFNFLWDEWRKSDDDE